MDKLQAQITALLAAMQDVLSAGDRLYEDSVDPLDRRLWTLAKEKLRESVLSN